MANASFCIGVRPPGAMFGQKRNENWGRVNYPDSLDKVIMTPVRKLDPGILVDSP